MPIWTPKSHMEIVAEDLCNTLNEASTIHIVDTHCHAGTNWFEPVEMLLHQMNTNGVQSAVLIPHGGNDDNQYLLECVQRFPGCFAAVVGVHPTGGKVLAFPLFCFVQISRGFPKHTP